MKKMFVCTAAAIALSVLFAGHGNARQASQPTKPAIIYVTDFEIDTGSITPERKLINRPRLRQQDDPGAKAAKLVELLSTSLANELRNKSVPAKRLYQGQNAPDKGWLVKGQFLEVDEGNRMRRAMVGFGAGGTEMQIEVSVIDLSSERKEPFLIFGTDSKTGKGPGAVVMMNPYVAAAKFVMSKKATERDVKKTARQIAGVLVNVYGGQ
ncbi:MAG: DUF4410 domain-containing protein [Syntrophobacteraceae bacterium]